MTGAERRHGYRVDLVWTGAAARGRPRHDAYGRDFEIRIAGKPPLAGSADAAFLGDAARHNPEDLLVASVAACHMLWYLHLAADAGLRVTGYDDRAEAEMAETPGDGGAFTRITLHPHVRLAAGADIARATALHAEANRRCFVANSLRLPVDHRPSFSVEPDDGRLAAEARAEPAPVATVEPAMHAIGDAEERVMADKRMKDEGLDRETATRLDEAAKQAGLRPGTAAAIVAEAKSAGVAPDKLEDVVEEAIRVEAEDIAGKSDDTAAG